MRLSNPKLLTLQQAARIRRRLRRMGGRLVLTNGVFDLLHPGHTSCLARARKLAGRRGRLFVALNSDRSVRQLKGPQRPILDERPRAYNLAQLRPVDGVVIFRRPRLVREIQVLQPDVYVKSHADDRVPGGGFAEVLPRHETSRFCGVGRVVPVGFDWVPAWSRSGELRDL